MTSTDDGKTVLSLAVERSKHERSFAEERRQMVRELTDLGLPEGKAVEIANDVLFVDWKVFRAQEILKTYGLDYGDARAVVELVAKLMPT